MAGYPQSRPVKEGETNRSEKKNDRWTLCEEASDRNPARESDLAK
jgi:hypothetical protein